MNRVKHKRIEIKELEIFYREAGNPSNKTILFLHGFPSSSFMFRHIIPELSESFHCLAPDYPAFGLSSFPDKSNYDYTFENYAETINDFIKAKRIDEYIVYLHDYGCPIGLRLALLNPKKVLGIIVQDGNAYEEGLGPQWDSTKNYWKNSTDENREKLPEWLNESGTRDQYLAGLPENQKELIAPEVYLFDWYRMSRKGNVQVQFDLFTDFRTNVEMYPKFQKFFREWQPPALIIWGKYDAYFNVEEASCYQRDLPNSELHILDAGHKALETHWKEIGNLIKEFYRN